MKAYTARRTGKRWREGAPEYVLDCLDNRGKSADRFTVLFRSFKSQRGFYVPYLAMDETPTSPQGISVWGELKAHEAAAFRYRSGKERVRWLDLPANIRAHVIARYTEEWMPYLCPKCRREVRPWPLKRGAKCSPKGWAYCIRNDELPKAEQDPTRYAEHVKNGAGWKEPAR